MNIVTRGLSQDQCMVTLGYGSIGTEPLTPYDFVPQKREYAEYSWDIEIPIKAETEYSYGIGIPVSVAIDTGIQISQPTIVSVATAYDLHIPVDNPRLKRICRMLRLL